MAVINILPSDIYNRIAAGEVVERPASVVKELVENSIDAGAKNISIEIRNGGKKLIKVSDNGSGIEKEYVKTAFLPHSTSKISVADDLNAIMTLGFRGEALASIASVSRVRLLTKTALDTLGSEVVIDENGISEQQKGSPDGTYITVSDLFYNVPARMKFFKSDSGEENEISNLISRLILANPNVSFRFIADNRIVFQSDGKGLDSAVYSVYGKQSLLNCLKLNFETDGFKLFGLIGKESFSKPNRTYQTLIINGRYIVNKVIAQAVATAYGGRLMTRQYPFWILHLTVPNDFADVNVHPNKLDVRFQDSNFVFKLVYNEVSRLLRESRSIFEIKDSDLKQKETESTALRQKETEGTALKLKEADNTAFKQKETDSTVQENMTRPINKIDNTISEITYNKDKINLEGYIKSSLKNSADERRGSPPNLRYNDKTATFLKSRPYESIESAFGEAVILENVPFSEKARAYAERLISISEDADNESAPNSIDSSTDALDKKSQKQESMQIPEYKNLGVLFDTYILLQSGGVFLLIDQHAAHERLLYDKLCTLFNQTEKYTQPLLLPYIFDLNAEEREFFELNKQDFESMGFEIEEFGKNAYRINAVPATLSGMDISEFIARVFEDSKKTSDFFKEKLMQTACKTAIKGGDQIPTPELETLLRQIALSDMPLLCPHGRPIAVRIKKETIERWFKRIV